MKPLSPMKFFIENKKRSAVVCVIVLLSIAVTSFITSIMGGMLDDGTNSNLFPFEHFSIMSKTADSLYLDDSVVDKVKSWPETDQVIEATMETSLYNALMGNMPIPIFFISDTDEIGKIAEHMGIKLIDGRLPVKDGYELALSEKYLKSKDLKIGDYFGGEVDSEEWLVGRYKIVGVLDSEAMIGFGNNSMTMNSYRAAGIPEEKSVSLLVIPKDGQLGRLNEKLDSLNEQDAVLTTKDTQQKFIDELVGSSVQMLDAVIITIVFILSISVGTLIYIIYLGRTDEFGILYAMGYTKGFIRRRIVLELVFLSALCWLLGFGVSVAMTYCLNVFLLADKGQSLALFTRNGLMNTIYMPIMVLVCAAIPIARKLGKWDPIAVIERRE